MPSSGESSPTSEQEKRASSSAADAAELAALIKRAGMEAPASLTLQVFKPLSWVGGQLAWMLQPFTEGLFPSARSRRSSSHLSAGGLAMFLEGEGNVERLVSQLDAPKERKEK